MRWPVPAALTTWLLQDARRQQIITDLCRARGGTLTSAFAARRAREFARSGHPTAGTQSADDGGAAVRAALDAAEAAALELGSDAGEGGREAASQGGEEGLLDGADGAWGDAGLAMVAERDTLFFACDVVGPSTRPSPPRSVSGEGSAVAAAAATAAATGTSKYSSPTAREALVQRLLQERRAKRSQKQQHAEQALHQVPEPGRARPAQRKDAPRTSSLHQTPTPPRGEARQRSTRGRKSNNASKSPSRTTGKGRRQRQTPMVAWCDEVLRPPSAAQAALPPETRARPQESAAASLSAKKPATPGPEHNKRRRSTGPRPASARGGARGGPDDIPAWERAASRLAERVCSMPPC